jgi:hypothetical protein
MDLEQLKVLLKQPREPPHPEVEAKVMEMYRERATEQMNKRKDPPSHLRGPGGC